LFERGVQLSDRCRKQLEEAETRVEVLIKRNGKLQPEAFRTDKA
jgi:exodeoxyribonuclease VII small subunit